MLTSKVLALLTAHDGPKVIYGETLGDALSHVRFDVVQLHDQFRKAVMKRIKDGDLSTKVGSELIEFYENQGESYTYLSPNGETT